MSPQIPPPPIPPPTQEPTSSPHPPPPKRQRLHPSPSNDSRISQKAQKLQEVENQRRELTKSIIGNLGRDELEELLLEAALGHEEVMRRVVRVNGGSHVQGRSLFEDRVESGLVRKRGSGRRDGGGGDDGGPGGEAEGNEEVMEKREERGLGMDGLRGVDGGGGGLMQFHHVTRRQFEVRMVRIREKGFEVEEVDWGAG